MRTYVLMSRMTAAGDTIAEVASSTRRSPRNRQEWLREVKLQCPEVRFLSHYALFGAWDFMDIYHAPDEQSAVKVSMLCSACTRYHVESWPALEADRVEALADDIRAACE